MLLQIPFYENTGDGNQCMQVAMQSALKYFLDKEVSLEELDSLTGRKAGLWTWPSQIVAVLHDLGLKVKFYSKVDSGQFLAGEPFIRKQFGKNAEKILKFTDLPVVMEAIKKILSQGLFEKRKLSFAEIESHLEQGHLPLVLIDLNKLVGKGGLFEGHLVAVTGFDDQSVFYHESGPKNPEANKRVPKQDFIDAWNAGGTDNTVVIVFGKRD